MTDLERVAELVRYESGISTRDSQRGALEAAIRRVAADPRAKLDALFKKRCKQG